MTTSLIINFVLSLVTLVVLLMLGTAILWNRFHNIQFRLLAAAVLTHFLAAFSRLLCALEVFLADLQWRGMAAVYGALFLDVLSIIIFAWLVLSDRDGRVRFKRRQQHLSVPMLSMAVFPALFAIITEVYFPEVDVLEFAYTLSLQMAFYWLTYNREHRLTEREERVTLQQSRVLAEQMQPHFIFNSLSSIEALCQIDPDLAVESLENFSGYLRGHIDALTSEEPVPFEQELEHIQQFVALEQADPSRGFTMHYELFVRDFRIPSLSVQPIVENAIQHGALSRRDGTGTVTLSTEAVGEFIRIKVLDNGLGRTTLTEKQKDHMSVGLKNAESRIRARGGTLNFTLTEEGGRAVFVIPKEGI